MVASKELKDFGLLVGGVIILLGIYYLFPKNTTWAYSLLLVGGLLVVLGLFLPSWLFYPYRGWMFVGQKIGWVVNRVVLSVFFLLILTPFALIRRLFNRDPLALTWLPTARTYYEDKKIATGQTLERKF